MPHSDSPSEELEDVPRGAEEIARRTLILSAVIACAYGADKRATTDWFTSQKLWTDVSPEEKAFLTGEPTPQAQIDMTWRIEALVPLLWALHKIDAMPSLAQQFDTTEAVKTLVFPPAQSRSSLRRRRCVRKLISRASTRRSMMRIGASATPNSPETRRPWR
jgi:hypothetical protein